MKIWFPNCGSGAGISICAAINGLLNWHKAERTQTADKKKNVPQITPGWDYRPRESVRRHAAVDAARAETAETLTSTPAAVEAGNMSWFDFINPTRRSETQGRKRHRGIVRMPVRRTTKVVWDNLAAPADHGCRSEENVGNKIDKITT